MARCRFRVAEHRRGCLEGGERQRQDPAERGRVDRDRRRRQAPAGDDHGEQPAEGVADDGRLAVEFGDDLRVVVGHVADALAGEDLRVRVGLLDGLRVVGPAG
jgi:hypothetical protein